MQDDPLDNPVWHSLLSVHGGFAERASHAARFVPDVSVFAGLPDHPTPDAWADLAHLTGEQGVGVVFRRVVEVPPSWSVVERIPSVQMLATNVAPGEDRGDVVALGPADAEEMLDLVRATRPGPFGPRTVELGGYLGIRREGALVAMAGERLRFDGSTEISAVCTRPEHRGSGMASRLVQLVVEQIRARGDQSFLHVAADNTNAIRLYEALGFEARCAVEAVVLRPPPEGSPAG